MKTIALAVSALALIASPALAQQSRAVNLEATVAGQCGLDNQSGGGQGGHTADVEVGTIVDDNGFLDTTKAVTIGFGNVWCNGPAVLSLTPTALSNPVQVQDVNSFVNKVDMIVDGATGTGGSIMTYFGGRVATTAAPLDNISIGSAFETGVGRFSQARVTFALPAGTAGNDRPIAGTYTGSVTLKVTAN